MLRGFKWLSLSLKWLREAGLITCCKLTLTWLAMALYFYYFLMANGLLLICYGTNCETLSDGRHLAPSRLAGPRDETPPSIVLMMLMV
jgi:hypothetical protein